MVKRNQVGIMLYGRKGEEKDIFSEVKYKLLAEKMVENGISVDTINYNDAVSEHLISELINYKAILVWVNPIEKDMNRQNLDDLLKMVSTQGVYVSTHPNTILKIGTKDVLYETRNMSWSSNVNIFRSYEEFEEGIFKSLEMYGTRVLKPYRGNGGKGIVKISLDINDVNNLIVQNAEWGTAQERINRVDFLRIYKEYFNDQNHLIDQQWCEHITNGMVRCYLTLDKVVGFGYQEINYFYPVNSKDDFTKSQPGKRYYFTEACGIFRDLKYKMETEWVSQLIRQISLEVDDLPILWDADFFIDDTTLTDKKYILCEINVSSVSPFPESAIMPIINILKSRIEAL